MHTKIIKQAAALMVTLCLMPEVSSGEGFRNPPGSASLVGRISGQVAHADGPSAIYLNPANLVSVTNLSVLASLSYGYAQREFDSAISKREKTSDPWAVLPSVYAAWPIKDREYVVGIGISTPMGRSSKWDDDVIFRFTSPTYAELGVVNVNPTIAMRLSKRLSFGVGIDLYYSSFKFRQFLPFSALTGVPTDPEGKAEFDGEGFGIGGNVGFTLQLAENHQVALYYRSAYDVEYDGDFDISDLPGAAAAIGASSSSDFETEIDFPSIIALGYGIQVTKSLRLGADIEWIEHSRFEELKVDLDNNNVLLPTTALPQGWEDNWAFGLGCDWRYSPEWLLRLGFYHFETPIQNDNLFLPLLYENDHQFISIGLGYTKNGHAIDVAFAYGIFEDQTVTDHPDPTLNGKYDIDSQVLSVSYKREL